jgi:hypothetical protein
MRHEAPWANDPLAQRAYHHIAKGWPNAVSAYPGKDWPNAVSAYPGKDWPNAVSAYPGKDWPNAVSAYPGKGWPNTVSAYPGKAALVWVFRQILRDVTKSSPGHTPHGPTGLLSHSEGLPEPSEGYPGKGLTEHCEGYPGNK